jgi:hypothetical protein
MFPALKPLPATCKGGIMTDRSTLVKELASRINALLDIPLINEQNEQIFFELVIGILMDLFLDELDKQLL